MKPRRHSPVEIAPKLEQAEALAADGKAQSEIAKVLGVSVMTFHRWRKVDRPGASASSEALDVGPSVRKGREQADLVAALQMENRHLRKIVTDLLLEKIRLEEAAGPRAA